MRNVYLVLFAKFESELFTEGLVRHRGRWGREPQLGPFQPPSLVLEPYCDPPAPPTHPRAPTPPGPPADPPPPPY